MLGRRNFFGSGFSIPGLALHNLFGEVEGSKPIFLGANLLVPHIEPLLPPPLHRVRKFQIEVFRLGSHGDDRTANVVDGVSRRIAPEEENALPQPEVRVDAQKTLAKSYKAGNLKNSIWSQIMMLKPVNKEEPLKKFMGMERKAIGKNSMAVATAIAMCFVV